MKKIIATLLCIAMLTALCGCGGGGGAETTVPTTTSAPLAADVYAEAAAKLSELSSLELVISYTEEMDLGADHFKTESKDTVTMVGLGTDAFAASTRETFFSDNLTISVKDVFLDGTLYTQINKDSYKTQKTAEEYQEDLLPVMLVNADLYGSVVQEADGSFTFTDASALEQWCDNPYVDPETVTVTATAQLDENGVPSKYTYNAEYPMGAANVTLTVTTQIKATETTEITAPADAGKYQAVEADENGLTMADIAAQLYLMEGYLKQAGAVTSTSTDMTICQAGGFTDTTAYTMATHGLGKDTIGTFNTVNQFVDLSSGKSNGYNMTETFNDGIFTTSIDGGTPESTPGITGEQIRNYAEDELMYLFPAIADITGYTLSVVGDTALLELTFSEAYGDEVEFYNCDYYFEDSRLLRNLASKYEITANTGYIGIDLTTGMPLSMGQEFAVTHTIDGQDFVFSVSNNQTLQLGSLDAYEAITGEAMPAKEPEEQAKPVFYKVTGTGGETMWLLGTIHVGDERTAFLPQEIYDAFAASDALALEFDSESYTNSLMEDEEAIAAYQKAMFYLDGTDLADHLVDGELYDNATALLKATGNYNAQMSNLIKPVFLESILSNYYLTNGYRLSGDYGVDSQLEDLARAQEKEILSVESGEFQMDMLGNLSEALQELLLKEVVECGQFSYNHGTQELFEMWCRGDEAELIKYLTEEEDDSDLTEEEKALYEEYENALGGMRNEDMLTVAQDYLNSGKTVFYAVGLAHLLAEDGLVNTLRTAGYTVELVAYAG